MEIWEKCLDDPGLELGGIIAPFWPQLPRLSYLQNSICTPISRTLADGIFK
jgi:hypothetical protein